ncbi:MAG: hypothetical protein Kow0031_16700 [Anaerolineae bacterium]
MQVVDGTGLGLSITKSFVEMLGGQIWVKSKVDVGTTFSFTVPVDVGDEAVNLEQVAAPKRTEVMLIGMEAGLARLLMPEIERVGLNPSAVPEADSVRELVRSKYHTLRAIVLDPGLQNGVSLLQYLKTHPTYKSVPVYLNGLTLNAEGGIGVQLARLAASTETSGGLVALARQLLGNPKNALKTRALSAKQGGFRVLIANNNRQKCTQLKDIFLANGYNAYCAFNSWQAVDMAVGNRPDIILMSMAMPEIDDLPLMAHLRHDDLTRHIPVILIATNPDLSPENGIAVLGQHHTTPASTLLSARDVAAEILSGEASSTVLKPEHTGAQ